MSERSFSLFVTQSSVYSLHKSDAVLQRDPMKQRGKKKKKKRKEKKHLSCSFTRQYFCEREREEVLMSSCTLDSRSSSPILFTDNAACAYPRIFPLKPEKIPRVRRVPKRNSCFISQTTNKFVTLQIFPSRSLATCCAARLWLIGCCACLAIREAADQTKRDENQAAISIFFLICSITRINIHAAKCHTVYNDIATLYAYTFEA